MQTASDIKALLAERGLAPRHALGQNFLIDQNLLTKLVDRADLARGELVLEIGPGTGVLTETLLARGCSVVACEIDHGLFDLLHNRLERYLNQSLVIVRGDALGSAKRLSPTLLDAIASRPFVLVANLPYSIASPLMLDLAIRHPRCRGVYVTIQDEVARRLLARPGSRDFGPLAVLVGATCSVKKIATLAPACFWPSPKVTSAMVAIERLAVPRTDRLDRLEHLTAVVFRHRRKQLGGVLRGFTAWPDGVRATDRAETCTLAQLIELSRRVSADHLMMG
ncbi:MAG: 16S rRNA (adenine(1518)-N(6)/adenine(1519)-N(6))-dimethyltransferase RsmA [Planctomycetota bacterium]